MLFNSTHYHKYIKGYASGTLVLHLNTKGIEWYKCLLPDLRAQGLFDEFKNGIEKQKTQIIKENQLLNKLREWLLPVVLNGQVAIK